MGHAFSKMDTIKTNKTIKANGLFPYPGLYLYMDTRKTNEWMNELMNQKPDLYSQKLLKILDMRLLVEKISLNKNMILVKGYFLSNRHQFMQSLLTSIIAIYKLITVTLCLWDLVAFFGVVERRTVRVMIPWRGWRRFRAPRQGQVTGRTWQ